MSYVKTGPFVSGGAPGIDAGFLNNVEDALTALTVDIPAPDVQDFTASGTWTKPAGATRVRIEEVDAGDGATGTTSGKGGEYRSYLIPATYLPASLTVTVGAGGGPGIAGGKSSVSSQPEAEAWTIYDAPGGVAPGGSSTYGGGAGGAGGAPGAAGGTGGSGGTSGDAFALLGGNGGKGGDGRTLASGMPGTAGTAPGGGGGGGGGHTGSGNVDGAPAAGARGQVRITTYFD